MNRDRAGAGAGGIWGRRGGSSVVEFHRHIRFFFHRHRRRTCVLVVIGLHLLHPILGIGRWCGVSALLGAIRKMSHLRRRGEWKRLTLFQLDNIGHSSIIRMGHDGGRGGWQ